MRWIVTILAFARCLAAIGALAFVTGGTVAAATPAAGALPPGLPAYATAFDAARDPQADLLRALERADSTGRRVLVVVGGDWCVWCFLLDRHLGMDADAARLFYEGFEVLRVYYGDDNTNDAFLARFPEFELFPHFFVVGSDARVLGSVTADVLIGDARYQTALIREFVAKWGGR